jgi:hypothetical protein
VARIIILILLSLFLTLSLFLLGGCKVDNKPPTLEKMGHLVSLKVNYSDVIEISRQNSFGIPWTEWKFPIGETKVLFVLKGDYLLSTDIRAAKYEQIDKAKRTVTLVLPAPTVTSPRVYQGEGGSHFYSISPVGISQFLPGDGNRTKATNTVLQIAQSKVEAAGKNTDTIKAAKENAENVLKGLFNSVDWNLTVKWLK